MRIIRNIFYVNKKISTGYQYSDQFSITPVDDIDQLEHLATYYPCIIEVKYDDPNIDSLCNDNELSMNLVDKMFEFYSKRISQIVSLLSVFTIYHFKIPHSQREWYNDGTKNRLISPNYLDRNFVSERDSFSEISTPAKLSSNKDYLISFQDEFVLPENIDTLFDIFFGSHVEFSEKFYKSAKLYHNARNIYSESVSLSFAAFISSVETLAQYHYQERKVCDKCGQPQFSATRKFKEFLLTYGAGNYLDKNFVEKIYKWRSEILHTGELFIWELERTFSSKDLNFNKREEQDTTLLMVSSYVRVALVNFLLREAKKK